jgi:hypothetical protein
MTFLSKEVGRPIPRLWPLWRPRLLKAKSRIKSSYSKSKASFDEKPYNMVTTVLLV